MPFPGLKASGLAKQILYPVWIGCAAIVGWSIACGGERDELGSEDSATGGVSVTPSENDDTSDGSDESESPEDDDTNSEMTVPDDDEDSDPGTEKSGDLPAFDIGEIPDWELPKRACDIDFLFVIDNSRSMGGEQDNLAASVPQFIRTLQDTLEVESFHLGVTTTEAYASNIAGCKSLGSLIMSTGGNGSSNANCGPYASGLNFMTQADDLDTAFPCAAKPGIQGDGDEKPMESMVNAIGPTLGASGACNEGFIRDDALLVIVIITDEEDSPGGMDAGSVGNPDSWYQSVLDVKGVKENVVVLSLIGVPPPNNCGVGATDGAEECVRISQFTEKFDENGFTGDVCAASYGSFFEEAVAVIDTACDNKPEG